ncbi:MAG: hypothetical protein ABGY75_14755, partial [Gemmataceae bacterium]
ACNGKGLCGARRPAAVPPGAPKESKGLADWVRAEYDNVGRPPEPLDGCGEEEEDAPAVEPDELTMLRLAYAKAIKAGQPANPSLADVEGKIDEATCELAIRFDVLPGEETLKRLLQRKRDKLLCDAMTEVGRLQGVAGQCPKLNGPISKALSELGTTKDISTKLHDAAEELEMAEDIKKYCKAKTAAGEAHSILNSASEQGDQRRKLGMLREAYEVLKSLDHLPPCVKPKPAEKSLAAELDIIKELGHAEKKLTDATDNINNNKDAYAELTAASGCLEEAREKVSNAIEVPTKDNKGKLTVTAREVCKELPTEVMDKLIELYCTVLAKLDELHSRAHAIDRVIGPSTQEGGYGPELSKLKAKPKYGAAARGVERGPTGALTVVVAQPIERDDAVRRVLKVLEVECGEKFTSRESAKDPTRRNPGLIDQAEDKVKVLQDLANPNSRFNAPWFCVGCKKDVPKCACFVGHYSKCGRECYVWVMPEQVGMLREFTQVVLTLAPNEKQDIAIPFPGRGAAFSPSLGR